MHLNQNDLIRIRDLCACGDITIDHANVMMVKAKRVQLCTARLPVEVRRALNAAVKSGELAHMKKDGHKPEVYYLPAFDYLAHAERANYEREVMLALAGAGVVSRAIQPVPAQEAP